MNKSNQRGFGVVEVLLIIAVVAVIGFIGWRVYDTQFADSNQSTEARQSSQTSQEEPPKVNNSEDLEKSEQYMKDSDVKGRTDTTEFDATLK